MSHVSRVEISIRNLEVLKRACGRVGFTFHENATTFKWFGRWVNDYHANDAAYRHGVSPENYGHCVHMIRVPEASYEIGVIESPKTPGEYFLLADFWGAGGLSQEHVQQLAHYNAVEQVRMDAEQQGLFVTENSLADGRTELLVEGY